MDANFNSTDIWKYKPKLQQDLEMLTSLKIKAAEPELCAMSVRADADRLSVRLNGQNNDDLGLA